MGNTVIAGRVASAVVAVVMAGALMTGCSAINAVQNTQSKLEACAKVRTGIATAITTITAQSATLTTDPKGAAAKISSAAHKLSSQASALSNAPVKKAARAAAAELTKYAKDVTAIESNPSAANTSELQSDVEPMQKAFAEVNAVCKV